MNLFTLVRSRKLHSLVQLTHNTLFIFVNPYTLQSVSRHPNKYDLILGTEHLNFLQRSMTNLRLFPSVIQYIENVFIYIILQVFVYKNQDRNNAVTFILQNWSHIHRTK